MAHALTGFDAMSLSDALYHRPERVLKDYLEDNFGDRGAARFSESFMSRAREVYTRVQDSRIYRSTLASVRRLRNTGRPDCISQLHDIDEMQQATPTMQRWVLANPTVRERFRRDLIEGYADTYEDVNKAAVRHTHADYRIVMDGVTVFEPNQTGSYCYHLSAEDRNALTAQDKGDVRITWANIDAQIWAGIDDPTSQYNAAL